MARRIVPMLEAMTTACCSMGPSVPPKRLPMCDDVATMAPASVPSSDRSEATHGSPQHIVQRACWRPRISDVMRLTARTLVILGALLGIVVVR